MPDVVFFLRHKNSRQKKMCEAAESYSIDEIPAEENGTSYEVQRAKLYLKRHCPEAGDNL